MSPKKRGRKKIEKNPLAKENAALQGEVKRLRLKLKKAETIIEVQKKISEMLGISQDPDEESNS